MRSCLLDPVLHWQPVDWCGGNVTSGHNCCGHNKHPFSPLAKWLLVRAALQTCCVFFFSDCLSSLTNFDHKKVPEALNKSQFLPVVFWAETRKLWFPLLVHSSKRHQRSNYYPANQAELMEPGSKFPTLPWVGCLSWSFRKFFSSKIVQDDSKHHTAQSSPFFGWPEE